MTLELKPGDRLAHFRLLAKLGEGGMGVVYKAADEKLMRTVAIKVLPDRFGEDERRRTRFLRGARSLAAVTHANIATVFEAGEADGRLYIAMEYVEGETLRAVLEGGALPVTEALRIAKQIARGLGKAHEKGIVHRDLKPDNVMLDEDGQAKILDFGLAKLRDPKGSEAPIAEAATATDVTQEGHVLGTPAYMSPEQARGAAIDLRGDVFSLGVVLYEMLTGDRPFHGDTPLDVIIAASRETPPLLSERGVPGQPELQP